MDTHKIIQNVIEYIDENIKSEISNYDLCNITGYSYIHLVRLFKQYLGATPNEYMLRRRLLFAVYEMNSEISKLILLLILVLILMPVFTKLLNENSAALHRNSQNLM